MIMSGLLSMALIFPSLNDGEIISLPQPNSKGDMSLEESIARRRSIREYASKPLSIEQISQLLWSLQGITDKPNGLRTAPSAGALYPLEISVAFPAGIYHYNPSRHELTRVIEGDRRLELQKAAYGQESIGSAPVVFVIAAVTERVSVKYGHRSSRYVPMEAGNACQNLLLQATALHLAGVPIGAFDDNSVAEAVKLSKNESPLYLVPIGYPGE
ncbi:MAG: SagB/ThcOx family dehydrogenase [Gammaproteobacteria bacterium]